jgi:hypothetical protein
LATQQRFDSSVTAVYDAMFVFDVVDKPVAEIGPRVRVASAPHDALDPGAHRTLAAAHHREG